MSWTAPRTWIAAEKLTAALLNTHVRDNLLETAVAKVTTAGDIVYATGANALTRLGIGSAGAVLVAGSSAPRWSTSGVTASGGAARNVSISNTLTAAANADVFEILLLGATIATGTSTGLNVYGLDVSGSGFVKTGTGTIDSATAVYIDAPTIATTNWAVYVASGNIRLGGTSSSVYIGDTANANMTAGVTITSGAADERLSAKLTGFAHNVTGVSETDTAFTLAVSNATTGGIDLIGFRTGSANYGLRLRAIVAAADTTKSTGAVAGVMISAAAASGTSYASLGANTNLMTIADSLSTVQFIFDADGDSHENGTGWTAYDDFDDMALLQALDHSLDKKLSAQAGAWLRENKAALQAARIVTFNDDTDGVPFINKSRLGMLLVGAMRQMSARVDELEGRLLALSA